MKSHKTICKSRTKETTHGNTINLQAHDIIKAELHRFGSTLHKRTYYEKRKPTCSKNFSSKFKINIKTIIFTKAIKMFYYEITTSSVLKKEILVN